MSKKTVQTIEDIAKLANVSKSTVSRALNDSPLIKEETREQIKAIAKENNFCFKATARSLSLGQSHTIAFITHSYSECFSMEDLFSLEIMGGISTGLTALGYDFLVVHVDPHKTDWAHEYLDSGKVDGFILNTSSRKQYHIKALYEMEAPFIVWGVPEPNYCYPSVTGDNISGGLLATEHLIKIGRQKIAFIGGADYEREVQQRYAGYEKALKNANREVNPLMVTYGDYSLASGNTAMELLLEQAADLDAVFVNSDLMAIGAINVIQSKGKRVPEDIAVVGYDDLSIAALNNLPLTTIRQNIPMAGRLLAQNLVQFIKSGVITNVTMPVELVIRKSA